MPHAHVNDLDLYYEETGAGDPLVLVHGGWSDHNTWRATVPGLAESLRVITYDRRGHSASERPAGRWTRRDQEDDLAALIEACGPAPAHVAGSSFGASIALGLAARRPDLVRSVVAHEPALLALVADDAHLTSLVRDVRATFDAALARLERGDVEDGTRRFFEAAVVGPGGWPMLPAQFRATAIGNAPAFFVEQRDPGWDAIDVAALSELSIPVLLTQGEQSPSWFGAVAAELVRLMPGARTRTYAGAGHTPHLTHPYDLVAAVRDFVCGVDPKPAAALT